MANRIHRLLFLLCLSPLAPAVATACDFCNCLMGINPYYTDLDELAVTMLYQRSYHGPILNGSGPGALKHWSPEVLSASRPKIQHHSEHASERVNETRLTFELSYRHHFSEHVMATLLLPLSMTTVSGGPSLSVRGTGDPTLIAHYVVSDLIGFSVPITLLAGVGVKLPLGVHTLAGSDGTLLDPTLQPGSGSVDAVADVLMTAQVDGWTFASDIYGKLNTPNSSNDRMGHSLALSASVNRDLYRDNMEGFGVVGITGIRQEIAGRNRINGADDPTSGFSQTYVSLGSEVLYGSIRLNATVMIPVIGNRPDGAHVEQPRLASGVRYTF